MIPTPKERRFPGPCRTMIIDNCLIEKKRYTLLDRARVRTCDLPIVPILRQKTQTAA
jgi:hypothetical protein